MGFPRQEQWSGLPSPTLGDLPDPGIEPASLASPALADRFLTSSTTICMGFPGSDSGKESTCQCSRCGFDPWVGKIPWRRKWQLTPVFLPGKSHGQRSLAGYSPWNPEEWAGATKQQHRVLQFTKHPHVPINQGTRANYALIF